MNVLILFALMALGWSLFIRQVIMPICDKPKEYLENNVASYINLVLALIITVLAYWEAFK